MDNNSLVLKGLTGSVILIGVTLVALPGAAAEEGVQTYSVTESGLNSQDHTSDTFDGNENQVDIAALPARTVSVNKEKEDEDDFEVLDLETEQVESVEVTESVEIEDYTVDFTDSDGEEAVYLTVREDNEIKHDDAYEEGEELNYNGLTAEIEEVDFEKEELELKTSVRNGYVLHGGPAVNELVEKLEKVNPRIDASDLKESSYNALIVTGDNTEEAVKNLASLHEGVKKSEIDIDTS